MTLPEESYDLVWACESGEHMPDKKAYVEEMTRMLKPGGTLVIACWCVACCNASSVGQGRECS